MNIFAITNYYCYAAFGKKDVDWLREDLTAVVGSSPSNDISDLCGRALERINELEAALRAAGIWVR